MNFGVPKEIREQENRIGLTPAGVHALVDAGHTVYIESKAGERAGFTDYNFRAQSGKYRYVVEVAENSA